MMRYVKSFFRRISKDLQHKQLIPLKILFFVHASTILVLYPYLTIHMRELGINVEETAIMSAVTPIVAIVMPPVAGMVADKIGNFKLLLAISSALSGASALLLLLVPVGRMTVSFPPRLEMAASCSSNSLMMSMYQQYPCELTHPYTVDVNMRVESCGFACRSPQSEDTKELSNGRAYAVKLRLDAAATSVYRYALQEHTDPEDSLIHQHSLRQLRNDENYSSSIRKLADTTYYFPTSNLYRMECEKQETEVGKYACRFGGQDLNLEGHEFNEEINYLTRISVQDVAPNGEKVSMYEAQFIADPTEKLQTEPIFNNVTCQNWFSNVSDLAVEVPLYNPDNPQEIYKSVEMTDCESTCLWTAPRHELCSNPSQNVEIDPRLTFWAYLSVRMFLGIIGGTAFAMFEGAVIAILREQNADYGLQRIYGSIGGMISSPLSGVLIDYASKGKGYTDFRPAFYLYAGLKTLSGILMVTINLEFKTPSNNIVADVITVLKNVELVALFIVCFILGTAWGYIESFLFWLLQDMGASRSLMGVTITVGGIAGLPLLVMSGPIIQRIGHANVLFIGFVFYAIRLLGYSLMYNPWLCLVFEAMEGVTSSLAFTAAVTYAARLSTTTTDTSVQGLLGGVYFGVGKGSGSLIGGYLMKAFGTRPTYQIFSAATIITGCIYFLFNKLYLSKRPQTEGNDICKKIPKVKPEDIEGCEKVTPKETNGNIANGKVLNDDTKEINANVKLYLNSVDKQKQSDDDSNKNSGKDIKVVAKSEDSNQREGKILGSNNSPDEVQAALQNSSKQNIQGIDNPAFIENENISTSVKK